MTTGNLTIQDNDTLVQYVSVGELTFVFPFPILETDELKVSRNQVLLSFGVDYDITGLGADGGGLITLLAGASTPGQVFTLWQDMPIERLTGFSAGAAVILGTALNAEFAARLRVEQQLRREIRNSIRLAPDDPVGGQDMVLPTSSRVGKYLGFDADGDPAYLSGTGNDSALRTDLANPLGPGNALVAYPRSAAEIAAAVVPQVYSKRPRDPSRYNPAEILVDAADLFAVFGNPRAKPAGFAYVDSNIFSCPGPGLASHDFDAEKNFLATYRLVSGGEVGGQFWVDGVNGSDANFGSLNDPYKTIKACMQGAGGLSLIWLMPGVYTDKFDVRATDNLTGGGTIARAVRIKAWAGPGSVIFRFPGQQPGEMAWIVSPGLSVYEATPTGGEIAEHIIYNQDGKEIQIQWYASAALANGQTSGWYQDPATKKIYVRHANRDFSLPGFAARLEIMYGGPGDHVLYGAKLYLEGVTFRGGNELQILHQIDGANNHRPVLYARNCKWQYLGYHSIYMLGGLYLFQDCVSENSLNGDGWNYNDDTSGTGLPCQAIEVDCIGRNNGTREYKSFDGDRNKQGSSGHGTTIVTRVNGEYYGNYGQQVADTGVGSKTWMVGSIMGTPWADLSTSGTGGYYNLWMEGTCWLDTVRAGSKASTDGFRIEFGTSKLFNCELYGTAFIISKTTGLSGIYDPTL
jgi:hypothetical protein